MGTWLVTRRRLLLLGVIVVLGLIGWRFSAYQRGMLVAWLDHSRGYYEMADFGYPPSWEAEYVELLQTRYGVGLKSVAGCVVTSEVRNWIDGYNAVSLQRIEARFGKDIFAECMAEAREAWERKRAKRGSLLATKN